MNILVTGANGQLGTEMRNAAASAGPLSGDHYVFTDVNNIPGVETIPLDITNLDALRIICESENIDVIVNCAAYTNVDKAEEDLAMAELLNATAPSNLALVAKERKATLIHISTDYVFKGNACVPYTEETKPEPTGAYGATKYQGEKSIIKSGCRYIIIRTAWLYSPYGKNFVKTMQSLTASKDSISVVFDQVGTPTYAKDLAGLIHGIIRDRKLDKTGIYHFSDEGAISWYDFAKAICRLSGNTCDIKPCHSSELATTIKRPSISVLDKTKVKNTFGIEIPYWLDSLEDCIERLK
ncbi:MAG: dTDP-4-dehydrorhamnose reductase [Bacteroidales bacterium]|nr:dTDP-4-dehydrorhamnose reductase [Bacteroidales bacterium]